MRDTGDKIIIQEPTIRHLDKKRRSCMKRTCVTGCGFIFLFLLVSILLLKLTFGPKTIELKKIPQEISTQVPVYDPLNNDRVTLTSYKERNQTLEKIAYIPKTIFSPILLINKAEAEQTHPWITRFKQLIKEPVTDQREIYTIEWHALQATPKFIFSYYTTELKKQGYSVEIKTETTKVRELNFTKDAITGNVFIEHEYAEAGTGFAKLTVYLSESQP